MSNNNTKSSNCPTAGPRGRDEVYTFIFTKSGPTNFDSVRL